MSRWLGRWPRGARRRTRVTAAVGVLPLLLLGCGVAEEGFPADPDGTSARIRTDHVVRAGAAPNPGWVELESATRPSGPEVRLVEALARDLGARVRWTIGTEEHLVGLLEDGKTAPPRPTC